ncbi:neuroguidin [Quercus suber]|uniref:Neuroguidin n=1 Tax=Quercus suber TaxID=58331 RepID=A0AAW0J6F7_QUESU
MELEGTTSLNSNDTVKKQATQLATLLKEMKEGLDTVRTKVQALTSKVKASQFPTADGISYLETKHLLLLNYCQSLVYYLLRKAKGFSIEGHPAVRSLIETRLFLEKEGGGGVYRPPKLVPVVMEEDKISKKERNALRKEKQMLRQSRQSDFMREMMDNMEGRPEEAKMEKRARQEEELFTRAPMTKMEKKKEKHLKKSRNGLLGLTKSFYDEIKALPLEDDNSEQATGFGYGSGKGKLKKRKEGGGGVYRPPKLVPVVMEEDKISKKERNALRKEKQMLRQSRQSDFMREMMDNMEGRPEEVREIIGAESVEVSRYKAKMEKRARQEEELFTRAPMTKMEKKKEKHLKKSRNGLLGLTKSFYDEIKALPLEDDNSEQATGFGYGSGKGKLKKRKVRPI